MKHKFGLKTAMALCLAVLATATVLDAVPAQERKATRLYRDIPFGFAIGQPYPREIYAHHPGNPDDPELWGKYEYAQDIGAGWERPGVSAFFPPEQSGFLWPQVTDRVYSTIPISMHIFANIDVRTWTATQRPEIPDNMRNLTAYHPPVSYLELIDEKKYIQFVKDLVERYDGDGVDDMPGLKNPIKYWQIDNELPGIPPSGALSVFTQEDAEWVKTSINNYAHILEITSRAVKSSDPEAKVAVSGIVDIGPGTEKIFRGYYLKVLEKLRGKYVDIFDYHFYRDAKHSWKLMKSTYRMIRQGLDSIGYKNMEIWITETATHTGMPREVQGYGLLQTEKEQAKDLVRRFIYPLAFGVKKVMWWSIMDCSGSEGPDGYMGLMYSGKGSGNPGYGVKKLSYYAYKKLVEVLEGSDWNNIQIIQESEGVYIYKFIKQGRPLWVVWSDSMHPKTVRITLDSNIHRVAIAEAVPRYESGKEVTDYSRAFRTVSGRVLRSSPMQVQFELLDIPVYVEGIL